MTTLHRRALLGLGLILFLSSFAGRWDDEGMWLLDSIRRLPLDGMKRHGLELTPDQIYNPAGTSIKDAIVLLGGGTSSFVSAEGLMITNHHVAFAGIQSLSSLQNDYLQDGFLAASRDQELPTTYTAQIVKEIRDVTTEVLTAVSDTMKADQRDLAIKARIADVEKQAKGSSDLACRVVDMYNGVKYYLFTYEVLSDVRLVYAPPSAIGNYGGEIDNWMWPRHTGDFSLMRAYVGPDGKPAKYAKENIPYHPKVFLPISTKGVTDSSFAMILGFPGRTYRYREGTGVGVLRDVIMPATIDLYKARIDVMETWGSRDRGVQIKYASKLRGVANTYKNYLGVLEGMKKLDLLKLKQQQEAAFQEHMNSTPALKAKYGSLLSDMAAANARQRVLIRRVLLAQNLTTGVDLLRLAQRFRQYASAPNPTEKDQAAVREVIATTFKNSDLRVEKSLFSNLVLHAAAFPREEQFTALRAIYGDKTGADREEAVQDFVDALYGGTDLATPEGAEKLLLKNGPEILGDDAILFLSKLDAEQAPLAKENTQMTATLTQLRRQYQEALLSWKQGQELYPDANRTLRFTYGQVLPFTPRDAVKYQTVTTLSGVMEKETGEEPFVVPAKLKQLWQAKDFGRYADPKLKDVPVAFIADLDITGGNSGSPVINGKGELIGCAFDGNWEAVVGDYYFQESLNRTISVDARYVLFVLDKFSNAQAILNELVIH